jgi:hypothetical protein
VRKMGWRERCAEEIAQTIGENVSVRVHRDEANADQTTQVLTAEPAAAAHSLR